MSILGGKWTAHIVWFLSEGPRRFTELKQDIAGISAKTLTERLQKLTSDGVILRTDMPTSPPTVEYSLSELGLELKPAIEAIVSVGHRLKLKESLERSALEGAIPSECSTAFCTENSPVLQV